MDTLFKAAENNKLMQKFGTGIAGKYTIKKSTNKKDDILKELKIM